MALVNAFVIFLFFTLGISELTNACSLTADDLVELQHYVLSKCESNLIVTEELFGFSQMENENPGASTIGGNLAVSTNNKILGNKPSASRREFSSNAAYGGKLHMASVVGPCTRVKFNKDLEDLLEKDLPDQLESTIRERSICRLAEKKLEEFQTTQFSGQCSGDSVIVYQRKLEYRFSRTPASVKLNIRSKGDPTAAGPTQRPIKVDLKKNTIEWGLPFTGDDGKLLKLSSAQAESVEKQISDNLEEFVQMSDCCTMGAKSKLEKKVCDRYNLKYEPKKERKLKPSSSI